jgi:hypothetical protein
VSEHFNDPEFWMAVAVALLSLGLFTYWLATGSRRSR